MGKENLLKLLKLTQEQEMTDYVSANLIEYELGFAAQDFFNQNHLITSYQALNTFKDKIEAENKDIKFDDEFTLYFKKITFYSEQGKLINRQRFEACNFKYDDYNLIYFEDNILNQNVKPMRVNEFMQLIENQLALVENK